MEKFPELKKFHGKIGSIESIKAYIDSEKRPKNFWGSDYLAGKGEAGSAF